MKWDGMQKKKSVGIFAGANFRCWYGAKKLKSKRGSGRVRTRRGNQTWIEEHVSFLVDVCRSSNARVGVLFAQKGLVERIDLISVLEMMEFEFGKLNVNGSDKCVGSFIKA